MATSSVGSGTNTVGSAASSGSKRPRVRASVDLTIREGEIFDVLRTAATSKEPQTVVRVAGGWVRDKLLGRASDDIDTSLDNLTGVAFAHLVNKELGRRGVAKNRVAVIKANPQQSKHLETATLKVMGVDIDFVNLRSEEYTEGSRIPSSVRIGTPTEDAFRRDLTINALFYNINEGVVEDPTKMGIDDLHAGRIRTPLQPKTTFLDDPLRVLRAVRFATRYDFALDSELQAAAKDGAVQAALCGKVSRERVGKEVCKYLCGPRPQRAMQTIFDLSLERSIFAMPPLPKLKAAEASVPLKPGKPVDEADIAAAFQEAASLLRRYTDCLARGRTLDITAGAAAALGGGGGKGSAAAPPPAPSKKGSKVDNHSGKVDATTYAPLAVVLQPLHRFAHQVKKTRVVPAVDSVVRASLKMTSKNAEELARIVHCSIGLRSLVLAGEEASIVEIGMLLRELKDLWPVAWQVALVVSLDDLKPPASAGEGEGEVTRDQEDAVVAKFHAFSERVHAAKLDAFWRARPLLNGGQLLKLGVPKGKPVGYATTTVLEWMIANPDGTADDCSAFIAKVLADEPFKWGSKK